MAPRKRIEDNKEDIQEERMRIESLRKENESTNLRIVKLQQEAVCARKAEYVATRRDGLDALRHSKAMEESNRIAAE